MSRIDAGRPELLVGEKEIDSTPAAEVLPEAASTFAAPGKRPAIPTMAMPSTAPGMVQGRGRGARRPSASRRFLARSCAAMVAGVSTRLWSRARAREAIVGCANISTSAMSRPRASRTLAWTSVMVSESPPRSKKLSWVPTRSRDSTSAQMVARMDSTGLPGPTYAVSRSGRPRPGAGSALRSTFPSA